MVNLVPNSPSLFKPNVLAASQVASTMLTSGIGDCRLISSNTTCGVLAASSPYCAPPLADKIFGHLGEFIRLDQTQHRFHIDAVNDDRRITSIGYSRAL